MKEKIISQNNTQVTNASIRFGIGDIAEFDDTRHRIVNVHPEYVVLCLLDTDKTKIGSISLDAFKKMILNEECKIIIENDNSVVDISKLSEYNRAMFEIRKNVIQEINAAFGPDYLDMGGRKTNEVISSIMQKYQISRTRLWRMIHRYLQSGLKESSLLNKEYQSVEKNMKLKPGSKGEYGTVSQYVVNENAKQIFEDGLNYYRSGRVKSYRLAYDYINDKYYSNEEILDGGYKKTLLPITERPSYRQFYYYCKNRLTAEEKDIVKSSRMEVRNQKRLLVGEDALGADTPGEKVEIDACEVDLSLISLVNFGQTVGRPIVYAMRDCVTHSVVAVSVAFDNNSVLGFTNLLLNLGDDKAEYCARYGINVPNIEKIWPSQFYPQEAYFDRGSDFKSDPVKHMFEELGITRHLVPGGTGSMKGMIEQWFHQMHSMINTHTEGAGLIEKRYDSNHHKEAVLTIDEFTKMLIVCVIGYNQEHMPNYMRRKEMVRDGVDSTPAKLWEYLCKTKGSPRPIQNQVDYMFKLMPKFQAKVSRYGIEFKHLIYSNAEDSALTRLMYRQQNRKSQFDIRYDPRDNNRIYYVRDGQLLVAQLSVGYSWMQDIKGLTFKETEDYLKAQKQMDADAKQRNDQIRAGLFRATESIVAQAKAERPLKPTKKNMKEARESEKQLVSKRNSITERLEKEGIKAPEQIPEVKQEKLPEKTEPGKPEMTDEEAYYDALDNY